MPPAASEDHVETLPEPVVVAASTRRHLGGDLVLQVAVVDVCEDARGGRVGNARCGDDADRIPHRDGQLADVRQPRAVAVAGEVRVLGGRAVADHARIRVDAGHHRRHRGGAVRRDVVGRRRLRDRGVGHAVQRQLPVDAYRRDAGGRDGRHTHAVADEQDDVVLLRRGRQCRHQQERDRRDSAGHRRETPVRASGRYEETLHGPTSVFVARLPAEDLIVGTGPLCEGDVAFRQG